MEHQAFQIIMDLLFEELSKHGFKEPVNLNDEEGRASILATEDVAYSVLFNKAKQLFMLRSTTLDADGKPTQWKVLSQWLFDENEGTKQDAESIANDFLEIVRGPKHVAALQTTKKKKKGEEGNVDPLFFFNRLVNVFPELKENMNTERIVFGKIRFATMIRAVVVPKCQQLCLSEGEGLGKLCEIFNDMYKDGDIEVRSLILHGIFNGLEDNAMAAIIPGFSEELQKMYKCSRKLKNKEIKPEKPKKKNKVIAAALDNANKNAVK